MNEAFALNMKGVSGYLVTTSGRSLEQIEVNAVMEVEVKAITAGHSVEENYRPSLIIEGVVNRLSGGFGEGISEVALDEGIEVVLDYTLSDDEIGRLAEKGFFNKNFPFKLSPNNLIKIPHVTTCMVFNDAEVPIIVVGQEEGQIACHADMAQDTDVLSCMEDYVITPKQEAPFSLSMFEQEAEARAIETAEKALHEDVAPELPNVSEEEMSRQSIAEEIIESMTRDVQVGATEPEWAHEVDIKESTSEKYTSDEDSNLNDSPDKNAAYYEDAPDVSVFEDDGEDYDASFE